jgi:hypothetical protein
MMCEITALFYGIKKKCNQKRIYMMRWTFISTNRIEKTPYGADKLWDGATEYFYDAKKRE